VDGCRPIPTYSREVRWDSQTDWRNVLPFLFSIQPSHSYTHRVRNGLTIAANVSTLFLITHYFDGEGRVCLLTCSHTAGTDDNLRRKGRSHGPRPILVDGDDRDGGADVLVRRHNPTTTRPRPRGGDDRVTHHRVASCYH
jgi:hypothetical protein